MLRCLFRLLHSFPLSALAELGDTILGCQEAASLVVKTFFLKTEKEEEGNF